MSAIVGPIEAAVRAAPMRFEPFPHLVVDDVLPAALLGEIDRLWPDAEYFGEEIQAPAVPGSFKCPLPGSMLPDPAQRAFWAGVSTRTVGALLNATLTRFGPMLASVFGRAAPRSDGPPDSLRVQPSLMQIDPARFRSHRTHHHFYHNPNWVMTLLLYLDDGEASGTTLSGFADLPCSYERPGDSEVTDTALAVLDWDPPRTTPKARPGYRRNRLLCFIDGPLSFHAVEPHDPALSVRRRLLRVHVAVNPQAFLAEHVHRLAPGMTEQDYRGIMGVPGFLPPPGAAGFPRAFMERTLERYARGVAALRAGQA